MGIQSHEFALFAKEFEEVGRPHRFLSEVLAFGVDGRTHKVGHRHSGDFNRRLKGHEDAFVAAIFGREVEQVFPVEDDFAFRHFIFRIAHQYIGQGGLAGAVGAHQHVHLSIADGQVDATEYFFAFY